MLKQFDTPKTVKKTFSNLLVDSKQTANNIGSFPFANKIGEPRRDLGVNKRGVAGIAIMNIDITPGTSINVSSSLNKAAKALYNYYSQGFTSQLSSVESSDLMIYQFAVSYLFVLLEEGRRVYGCMRKYSNYNAYIAEALVEALGFDYDNLASNLANFRAEFNIRVNKLNKALHIAPQFNVLTLWAELMGAVYTDNITEKFQMYAFKPNFYGMWSATGLETGSALKKYKRATRCTMADYFTAFDALFDALIEDYDVNNISGVMLRVYGDSGVAVMPELTEDYMISFEYDPSKLKLIQNLEITGSVKYYASNGDNMEDSTDYFCFQEGNVVKVLPALYVSNAPSTPGLIRYCEKDHMLTFPYENPTPEEVLEACIGKVGYTSIAASTWNTAVVFETSPILCTSMTVMYMDETHTSGYDVVSYMHIGDNEDSETHQYRLNIALETASNLSTFDWHPFVYLNESNNGYNGKSLGEVSNYTFLSNNVLSSMINRMKFYLFDMKHQTKSTTK